MEKDYWFAIAIIIYAIFTAVIVTGMTIDAIELDRKKALRRHNQYSDIGERIDRNLEKDEEMKEKK